MTDSLALSLQITLVGMGLVFAAIVLLWALMAALVRLTDEKTEPIAIPQDAVTISPEHITSDDLETKRRAAIAAVSVALAENASRNEPHEFPLPHTAIVSAWQAVMRTRVLNRRGPTR